MPSPRGPATRLRTALGRALLCGAAALWVAGCAKTPPVDSAAKGKPAKTAKRTVKKKALPKSEGNCISPRAVTNFRVLDRTRILVNTYPQRVIELYDSCDGVRFMEELTFAGTGGIICDYRGDALIVQGVRCPIASIKDFEADADAELRKEIEGATPEGDRSTKKKGSSGTEKSPE
jgi:hypothetical protein